MSVSIITSFWLNIISQALERLNLKGQKWFICLNNKQAQQMNKTKFQQMTAHRVTKKVPFSDIFDVLWFLPSLYLYIERANLSRWKLTN